MELLAGPASAPNEHASGQLPHHYEPELWPSRPRQGSGGHSRLTVQSPTRTVRTVNVLLGDLGPETVPYRSLLIRTPPLAASVVRILHPRRFIEPAGSVVQFSGQGAGCAP